MTLERGNAYPGRAIAEALYHELKAFGVRFVLMEPGRYAKQSAQGSRASANSAADVPPHAPIQRARRIAPAAPPGSGVRRGSPSLTPSLR